jgi:hypothetical protein
MNRTWITGFIAGVLTGAFVLLGVVALMTPSTAEAQLPEQPHEQIQILREISGSLNGIEQAVQQRCP